MEISRSILIVGFASLAIFVWLFRYEVQPTGGMVVMKYDRWTRLTQVCVPAQCYPVPK
jgi:hypothetical protein